VSYRYDAFLSYRRVNAWPGFVQHTFLPMLTHWLQEELDQPPRIFFDAGRLEAGGDWPQELAEAVASSKIMICLWSKQYFTSDWCKAELGHMLARRKAIGGSPLAPIIVPAVIHDGDSIPADLRSITKVEIQEYASPWLGEGSKKKEELSDKIRRLAANAGHALQQVPPFDPGWSRLASDEFGALFAATRGQYVVPSLGGALA
jgi:hypothetical protein